jgi:hypothetical protein
MIPRVPVMYMPERMTRTEIAPSASPMRDVRRT